MSSVNTSTPHPHHIKRESIIAADFSAFAEKLGGFNSEMI
jgi:hypothetical protein